MASAIVEHDASLPTTKLHAATRPQKGPSCRRPYTYVPPDSGWTAASCADEVALQSATTPATASPISNAEPAASAAGPHTTNTPAPTIDPAPTTMASLTPSRRRSVP